MTTTEPTTKPTTEPDEEWGVPARIRLGLLIAQHQAAHFVLTSFDAERDTTPIPEPVACWHCGRPFTSSRCDYVASPTIAAQLVARGIPASTFVRTVHRSCEYDLRQAEQVRIEARIVEELERLDSSDATAPAAPSAVAPEIARAGSTPHAQGCCCSVVL